MDWSTIAISLLGAGSISGGMTYVLKRTFDKTIELQITKVIDQNKAFIQESTRRQAAIYDKQLDTFQLSISLAYRLRNTIRELHNRIGEEDTNESKQLFARAQSYHHAFVELLYEKRAILTDEVFDVMHELKQSFAGIQSCYKYIERAHPEADRQAIEIKRQGIKVMYDTVDMLYKALVNRVQQSIGVEK